MLVTIYLQYKKYYQDETLNHTFFVNLAHTYIYLSVSKYYIWKWSVESLIGPCSVIRLLPWWLKLHRERKRWTVPCWGHLFCLMIGPEHRQALSLGPVDQPLIVSDENVLWCHYSCCPKEFHLSSWVSQESRLIGHWLSLAACVDWKLSAVGGRGGTWTWDLDDIMPATWHSVTASIQSAH